MMMSSKNQSGLGYGLGTADRPTPVLIGFFPKKVVPRTDWFKNPVVRDICSVSTCISEGPENWIVKWKHNTTTWMFDSQEAARSVLKTTDVGFTIFAYRVFPILFDGEATQPWDVSAAPSCDLSKLEFLGYDIVSRYGGSNFSCSPLSCNNGCEIMPVNEHCLIDDLETAWNTAQRIAAESKALGTWEPGPYCLVEVYREKVKRTKASTVREETSCRDKGQNERGHGDEFEKQS